MLKRLVALAALVVFLAGGSLPEATAAPPTALKLRLAQEVARLNALQAQMARLDTYRKHATRQIVAFEIVRSRQTILALQAQIARR